MYLVIYKLKQLKHTSENKSKIKTSINKTIKNENKNNITKKKICWTQKLQLK